MFIGRDQELAALERKYRTSRAELIALCGCRRVGKTALIREFLRDKPHIYFAAHLDTDAHLLATFSQLIRATIAPDLPTPADFSYQSWEEAFQILATAATTQRLICVIDEYPYLVQSGEPRKRVATMLQTPSTFRGKAHSSTPRRSETCRSCFFRCTEPTIPFIRFNICLIV